MLSGSGELIGEDQTFPISESAVAWVPAGVPHGAVAGPSGMFEIGFQSPPGSTLPPLEAQSADSLAGGMLAESLSVDRLSPRDPPEWVPVFEEISSRYIRPHYSVLSAFQELRAEAVEYELVVVVVQGAIELPQPSKRVAAFAALQICPGEATELRALESPTLLLGIRAILSS
jgi:hypothetical protein